MPGKIFVNYRRDDAPGDARGVRDAVAAKLGKANVFMDVDNLLVGQRFDIELAKALDNCDMLIAIIGPRWMELLRARQVSGERDYVREEIAAALKRGIVVIPVRVGREGQMPPLPRPEELPEDVRDLVLYQKHDVTHEKFGRDAADLIEAIKAVRKAQAGAPGSEWGKSIIVAGAIAIGVGLMAVVIQLPSSPSMGPGNPTPQSFDPGSRPGTDVATTEDKARASQLPASPAANPAPPGIGGEPPAPKRRVTVKPDVIERIAEQGRQEAEADRQRIASIAAEVDRKAAEAAARLDAEEAARRDPALSVKPGSGQSFKDKLANGKPCSVCPEMVVAPSGSFTMGSPSSEEGRSSDEEPLHKVTIAKPFAVGRYAVTFDEWDACVADGGCKTRPSDQGWGRGRRPVINVSWDDVTKEFLPWLNKKTGKTYRLLSEAEREYVTRAGTTTPFWWGSSISTDKANYDGTFTYAGSAKGEYRQKTMPVDSFASNPWGLYQVHGNVWEWTEDCEHDSYKGAPTDGSAWTTACTNDGRRVVRGGSWNLLPQGLRSALRYGGTADVRDGSIGFRVGRTLTP